jgi:hypothetical protein
MNIAVFWVVALCSLVDVYRHIRGARCLHHPGSDDGADDNASIIALMMEAASTSETSVNFCHTTRCNNPEDSHLDAITSLLSNLLKTALQISSALSRH